MPSTCGLVDDLAGRIAAFLDGADVRFSLEHVRLDLCPPFQRKVLLAEYGIPRGRVSTYRRIAAHLGVARGARAVGNALATNPFPIVIPCHRAIRSDGTLGGYQGGLAMKRVLLEQEGVDIDERGRVRSPSSLLAGRLVTGGTPLMIASQPLACEDRKRRSEGERIRKKKSFIDSDLPLFTAS